MMELIAGVPGRIGYSPPIPVLADLSENDADADGKGELSIPAVAFSETLKLPDEFSYIFEHNLNQERIALISGAESDTPKELLKAYSVAQRKREEDYISKKSKRLDGPIQFVLKLLEYWNLGINDAVGLLGYELIEIDYVNSVLEGNDQFRGRDVRYRIAYLFQIRETLWSLFRDLEVENEWLREPHTLLGDRSPMSLLLSGSMDDFQLAMEYVDTVAGR